MLWNDVFKKIEYLEERVMAQSKLRGAKRGMAHFMVDYVKSLDIPFAFEIEARACSRFVFSPG